MHCDPFDCDDLGNLANMSFEEGTLVQESENKDGVEFSLTVDDESSDDDQEGRRDERDTSSAEIDIWKEFREMSVASSQGTLAYDTTVPQIGDHQTSTTQLVQEVVSPDQDHIKKFTLQDNIVTIPELGIFKRKEPFGCLATIQVIQKMLSQSIIPAVSELTIASGEPENTDNALRYPLHSRDANILQVYHQSTNLASQDPYNAAQPFNNCQVGNPSSSKSPFEGTEDERRSQLYDSLVRAQRRYAEKLSSPTGPSGHFTKQEWDSLGDGLDVQEWEGGFLNDGKDWYQNKTATENAEKKENIGGSSWKGKEKCVPLEMGSDEEEVVTLRMKF